MHGGDASASRVPANGEGLGHREAHRGDQGDEESSVVRGGAPGRAPPPGIARRSWCGRRPKSVDDGRADLQGKWVSHIVHEREQREGRRMGCKGAEGIAGVGRGVLDLPAEVAAVRRRKVAA